MRDSIRPCVFEGRLKSKQGFPALYFRQNVILDPILARNIEILRLNTLKVNVDSLLNDDGSFSIFVSDTGYGMNDADVATAMSVFGQVDSGHNRMHEGTGLGLPLTKGLMELHDGTLEIESLEGYGTMVTVTFPKERVIQDD